MWEIWPLFCEIFGQIDQVFKFVGNFGIFDHFWNADKIKVYGLFNKIVNNFVKKVVKSGHFWFTIKNQINIMYL